MSAYTVREIAEMKTIAHGCVRLAAAELGVSSFGMQVLEFPPGFEHYPEHDHAGDRMEEVYVVLDGSATFVVDGEGVDIDPRRMLRVAPEARRTLEPGADGVRLLAIGATLGRAYERPEDFRLEAPDPAAAR